LDQPRKRQYVTYHHIDPQRVSTATVNWTGQYWQVVIDDQVVPDCCETLEEAYTVAEREMTRLFPDHTCHTTCRPWQSFADETRGD
jgi:hypothetical protein